MPNTDLYLKSTGLSCELLADSSIDAQISGSDPLNKQVANTLTTIFHNLKGTLSVVNIFQKDGER